MASGLDPHSLLLDHLQFVQMGGGHLGEPDRASVVQDVAHYGLVCGHQGFSREAPVRALMTLRAFDARSTQSRA